MGLNELYMTFANCGSILRSIIIAFLFTPLSGSLIKPSHLVKMADALIWWTNNKFLVTLEIWRLSIFGKDISASVISIVIIKENYEIFKNLILTQNILKINIIKKNKK